MTRKIGISVSDELLAEVDRESGAAGLSRSGFFGEAVGAYLREKRRRRNIERYVASYTDDPETEEEVAATDAFARQTFAGEQ